MDSDILRILKSMGVKTNFEHKVDQLLKERFSKVYLQRTDEMSEYEKYFFGYNPKLHKPGWVTWVSEHQARKASENELGYYYPENNFYKINFHVESFKIITKEEYYDRAVRQQ